MGAFYLAALGAFANAAREWREQGAHEFWQDSRAGLHVTGQAFD